jgi:hypothetical protein
MHIRYSLQTLKDREKFAPRNGKDKIDVTEEFTSLPGGFNEQLSKVDRLQEAGNTWKGY